MKPVLGEPLCSQHQLLSSAVIMELYVLICYVSGLWVSWELLGLSKIPFVLPVPGTQCWVNLQMSHQGYSPPSFYNLPLFQNIRGRGSKCCLSPESQGLYKSALDSWCSLINEECWRVVWRWGGFAFVLKSGNLNLYTEPSSELLAESLAQHLKARPLLQL